MAEKDGTPSETQKKSRDNGVGCLVLFGVFLLIFLWCSHMARQSDSPEERARHEAQQRREAAQLASLKAELCTPEMAEGSQALISTVDLQLTDVFVDPLVWAMTPFDARHGFARWASICLFDGSSAEIRHADTGRELASYLEGVGYRSRE